MSPTIANTFDMGKSVGFLQGRSLARNRAGRTGEHLIVAWVDHAIPLWVRYWKAEVKPGFFLIPWRDITNELPTKFIHEDAPYDPSTIDGRARREEDIESLKQSLIDHNSRKGEGRALMIIVAQGQNQYRQTIPAEQLVVEGHRSRAESAHVSLFGPGTIGWTSTVPQMHRSTWDAKGKPVDWQALMSESLFDLIGPMPFGPTSNRPPISTPDNYEDAVRNHRAITRDIKGKTPKRITNIVFPEAGPNGYIRFNTEGIAAYQKQIFEIEDVAFQENVDHRWYRQLANVVNEVTAP